MYREKYSIASRIEAAAPACGRTCADALPAGMGAVFCSQRENHGGRRHAYETRNAGSGRYRCGRGLGDASRGRGGCGVAHRRRFRDSTRCLRLPRARVRRPGEVSVRGEARLHAAASVGRALARAPARPSSRPRRGGATQRLRRRQCLHHRPTPSVGSIRRMRRPCSMRPPSKSADSAGTCRSTPAPRSSRRCRIILRGCRSRW